MNITDITPELTSDIQTIGDRTYTVTCDDERSGCNPYSAIGIHNPPLRWVTNNTSLPHWLIIDYGDSFLLSKIEFSTIDDVVDVLLKNYEIHTSLDGVSYEKVAEGTYVHTHSDDSILVNYPNFNYTPEEVVLNQQILCRYVKIVITSTYGSRGYHWAGLHRIKIYGSLEVNKQIYVSKNNTIWGI